MEENLKITPEQKEDIRNFVDKAIKIAKPDVERYVKEVEELEKESNGDECLYRKSLKRGMLLSIIASSEKIKIIEFCARNGYFKGYEEEKNIIKYQGYASEADTYDLKSLKFNYVRLNIMNTILSTILIILATDKNCLEKFDDINDIDDEILVKEINKCMDEIGEEKLWGDVREEYEEEEYKKNKDTSDDFLENSFFNNKYEKDSVMDDLEDLDDVFGVNYVNHEDENKKVAEDKELEDKFRVMFEKFMKEYKM